jgi:hypothetical protein
MQIDKTAFLALMGTFSAVAMTAAVGCTITTVSPAGNDGGTDPVVDSGGGGGDGGVMGDGGGVKTDAGGDSSAACLGKLALPAPDCEALAADPAAKDCMVNGYGFTACSVTAGLKDEIAVEVMKCVSALNMCPAGDKALIACVENNVAKSCDDPATDKPCQDELDRCATNSIVPDISKATCKQVLSALNAQGVADFVTCTTDRASGCTLKKDQYQCLDEYKSSLLP